jgi:hypothetical protein
LARRALYVVLDDVAMIADNGEIAVNGLPPGCDDGDVCGHPYLLIPIGDCDDELSAKITAQQAMSSVGIGTPSRPTTQADPIQKAFDRFRRATRHDPQGARHTD